MSLPAAGDVWDKGKPWIWHRLQWPSFSVGNQNRDCVGAWRLFPGHLPDLVPRGNEQWAEKQRAVLVLSAPVLLISLQSATHL